MLKKPNEKEKNTEIEAEFIMQLFKILFDPYISVQNQLLLIQELRAIITSIYEVGKIVTEDKIKSSFAGNKI